MEQDDGGDATDDDNGDNDDDTIWIPFTWFISIWAIKESLLCGLLINP